MEIFSVSFGTHLWCRDGQVNIGLVRYCYLSLRSFHLIILYLIVMSGDWSLDIGLQGLVNVLEQMSSAVRA